MASRQQANHQGWSYEAIKLLLRDRPVAYHPIIARTLGSVTAGLFLSQVLYWQDKGENKEGWIYKTQAEIEYETGLSRREQETARKVCRKVGVLEDKRMGAPAKLYYRPNIDNLIQLLADNSDAQSGGSEDDEPESPSGSKPGGSNREFDDETKNSCKSQNGGKRQTRMAESAKLEWRDSTDKNGGKRQTLYRAESTPETTSKIDLPSVDPSAQAPAREGSSADGEAGPTDRLTDGWTDEDPSGQTSESSIQVQLLEPEDAQHGYEQAPDLPPKGDEDSATPSAADALRQRAEAIPNSEVSDEARQLTAWVLERLPLKKLPSFSEQRDQYRIRRLAEHYQRQKRASVLRGAAADLATEAHQQHIRRPWAYLIACCVEAEKECPEADEYPLASLSGDETSSSSEEGESAGYEWFFNSDEKESDATEDEQRQHTPEPAPEAQEVWEKVLEDVSGEINAPSLGVWFEGTVPVSLSSDTLTISVPNGFARGYIESRFKELLEEALAKHLSPTSALEIVVEPSESTNNTNRSDT